MTGLRLGYIAVAGSGDSRPRPQDALLHRLATRRRSCSTAASARSKDRRTSSTSSARSWRRGATCSTRASRDAAPASLTGTPPAGAFYAFLKIDPTWRSPLPDAPASPSWAMTEFLIKRGRIGCVPGVDFGAARRRLRALLLRARSRGTRRRRSMNRLKDRSRRYGTERSPAPRIAVLRVLYDASRRHATCRPPSTRIVSPVTKSESMSASTAFAISSAPPQRPSGVASSTALYSSARRPRRREDRTRRDRVDEDVVAGQLERERFGQRLHAGLRDVVRRGSPCSAAGRSRRPSREKLMMRPPPDRAHQRHGRAARRETRRADRRASCRSQAATSSSSNGTAW